MTKTIRYEPPNDPIIWVILLILLTGLAWLSFIHR